VKKEERDALKKLEKVMQGQLLVLLTATDILVSLCESMEKSLEGVKLLARAPEGFESEPKPEKPLDPEEYDGYVENPEDRAWYLDEPNLVKYEENLHPEEDSGWIG
jgi:hypothetical protein